MHSPTYWIMLITQTQDTLPTLCWNPQDTSLIKICVPVFVYMGKPAVQTPELSSLLPHYPSRRLIWRVGDIKVEEVKNGLDPVHAYSTSLTKCAVWLGASYPKWRDLVNDIITKHIWAKSKTVQNSFKKESDHMQNEPNPSSFYFKYIRVNYCLSQIVFHL